MLRITPSVNANAAKQYYTKGLERGDYYLDGQELPGVWGGKGAELLTLSDEVKQKDYFALCDNQHPEGGQLTARMNENRRVGYDWTFSTPKSVSVMYELTGDERILEAHQQSVRETMAKAEAEMKTRVRANGANEDRVTGNMVFAEFTHFTSRPVDGKPDPHLHTHVFVFNATHDGKEWKAGQFGDLKRDAPDWEADYDGRMAYRLNQLGYATEKRGLSYEIASVPQSVIDKFSRRRDAIEKEAGDKGVDDAQGKHEIGRRGREGKAPELTKTELRKEWRSRLTESEASTLKEGGLKQGAGARESLQYAIDHTFERQSTIPEKRLKTEALKYGVGSVLPDEIDREMKNHPLIRKEVEGQTIVTTEDALMREVGMLKFAREGRGRFKELGDVTHLPHGLTAEQGAAAALICHSRDRVVGIKGDAGTGKTHTIKAVKEAIEANGQSVHLFAPSSQASRGVLRNEGFKDAETLESLLVDESRQKKIQGQVIWVDEAGMVSNGDMSRLFKVAEKQNARVVLSGDYKQHGSVKAGDAFRILESEGGVRYASLRTVRRQKDQDYRLAVEAIAKGNPKDGFNRLDRMGAIVEATGEDRHRMLVADYMQAQKDGKEALIVSPSRVEGRRVTAALRTKIKANGGLSDEREFKTRIATDWTDAQKGDSRNYEPGMVVEFHQNAKGFTRGEKAVVCGTEGGVSVLRQNGTVATLPSEAERFQVYRVGNIGVATGDRIKITKNGKTVEGKRVNNGEVFTVTGFKGGIQLSNGQTLPETYGHMNHGYVDTSYGSQGKTVDRVFVAAGNESLKATNQQAWYVAASRGREQCKVYVDSKDEVRDAIARNRKRLSAIELVRGRVNETVERTQQREYGERKWERASPER